MEVHSVVVLVAAIVTFIVSMVGLMIKLIQLSQK